MTEEPETNPPRSPAFEVARSIPPRLVEELLARADADALLGNILAYGREDPVPEEYIGTLVAVDGEKITIDARRRFEIQVEDAPSSLRGAIGKKVGVLVMDGKVRWRLVDARGEDGK